MVKIVGYYGKITFSSYIKDLIDDNDELREKLIENKGDQEKLYNICRIAMAKDIIKQMKELINSKTTDTSLTIEIKEIEINI